MIAKECHGEDDSEHLVRVGVRARVRIRVRVKARPKKPSMLMCGEDSHMIRMPSCGVQANCSRAASEQVFFAPSWQNMRTGVWANHLESAGCRSAQPRLSNGAGRAGDRA